MQKLLFKILFAILLLAAGISAQAANVIVMVTAKSVGDTINLDITANGSYTVSGANSVGGYSYTLTSDTVTITGDVTEFHCDKDSLTALDVSHNTTLGMLDCTGNRLTALDVSLNTTLGALYCNDNRLTALDVSKNVLLDVLNCSYNSLDLARREQQHRAGCA
jgi:Leucine-rich repeat (LRR) protein